MQEQNPDTVLERQPPAAEPEAQTETSAADTQKPLAEVSPETEEQAPVKPDEPADVTVVDIRFRNNAKSYYFDPDGLTLTAGTHVIIDTARGDEFGICAAGNHPVKPRELVLPLRKVLRVATPQDERTNEANQEKEKKAFEICQQKIAAHGLEMQLVSAECAFDGSKLLFFFTADGRVDFRELVKDLASVFRTRIELRQIGVRDKAKMVGGLGVCGRPFCCKEFLDDFQPVSIKMAKTQNLSLNPTKISGTCGRLMCCLKYEQEAYEDLIKTAPKQESFVDTPDGRGTVIEVNLLRQSVKVRMEDHPETIGTYKNTDICVLRSGKARKNDPPIPKDLAPISSKPRPVQKKEAFFEELPEVIYPDAVAVIAPEPRENAEEPEEPAADAQAVAAAAADTARSRRASARRRLRHRKNRLPSPKSPAPTRPGATGLRTAARPSRTSRSVSHLRPDRSAWTNRTRLTRSSPSLAAADAAAEQDADLPGKGRLRRLNDSKPPVCRKRGRPGVYRYSHTPAAGRGVGGPQSLAVPDFLAASATAFATAGPTRGSNALGMI